MIEPLFETPIYYNWVNTEVMNKSISRIIDKINFVKPQVEIGSFLVNSELYFNNVLKTYDIPEVQNEIEKHIREYCDILKFKFNAYDMVSWIVKMNKGDYLHYHTHTPTHMSGVYYYQASGKDAKIVFESPNPLTGISKVYNIVPSKWEHSAETGKIILFPSWLKHGVYTQLGDDTRIVLSFNITFFDEYVSKIFD